MKRQRAISWSLLATVAACSGLSHAQAPLRQAEPARARPAVLVVRVAAKTNHDGGVLVEAYQIGKQTVAVDDAKSVSKAIQAAKGAAAVEGTRPLRMRILTHPDLPYSNLAPILRAAAACGVSNVSLAVVRKGAPGGVPPEPKTVEFTPVGDEIFILIRTTSFGAVYEMTGVPVAMVTPQELAAHLGAQKKRLGTNVTVRVYPEPDTPSEFVVAALTEARQAGFRRIELLQPRPRSPSGPLPPPWVETLGGPASRFFGARGNACHVVYVIDRSGSMAAMFDQVRMELLRSTSRLKPVQDFTVILLGNNKCIEGPGKKLVSADIDSKLAAVRFLKPITASGQTTVLPALKRAFVVLGQADKSKPGKLIYLLSDGDFAGVTGGSTYVTEKGRRLRGNDAVVQWLRDHNKEQAVRINTLLLHSKSKAAVKVFQTIAKENGGRYRHISPDE